MRPKLPSRDKPSTRNAARAARPRGYRVGETVKGLSSGAPPARRRCGTCGGLRENTTENFPSLWEMPETHTGPVPCRRCMNRTSNS